MCRSRQNGVFERLHAGPHIPGDFATALEEQLDAAVGDQQRLTRDVRDKLTKQLAELEDREQRLIEPAAVGIFSGSVNAV